MQLKAAKSGLAKMFFFHTYRTILYKIPVKLLRIEITLSLSQRETVSNLH